MNIKQCINLSTVHTCNFPPTAELASTCVGIGRTLERVKRCGRADSIAEYYNGVVVGTYCRGPHARSVAAKCGRGVEEGDCGELGGASGHGLGQGHLAAKGSEFLNF